MKYTVEESLSQFNFWSGAINTAEHLTEEQFDEIESVLEDCYPDGITDTQINDLFWFESDWIAEQLGFADWKTLVKHNKGEDEEEETEEWDEEEELDDEDNE